MELTKFLKDCPRDTELYSPVYGKVKLHKVLSYGIDCVTNDLFKKHVMFHINGKLSSKGECMLFPSKYYRDWNNFFKDGDVIITTNQSRKFSFENVAIFKKYDNDSLTIYCQFNAIGEFNNFEQNVIPDNWKKATDEETFNFFKKLHEEGYDFIDGKVVKAFKYGDIVAVYNKTYDCVNIGIFDKYLDHKYHKLLCVTCADGTVHIVDKNYDISNGWYNEELRLATKEEQQLLLAELDEIGYKWEKGELIPKPKFKVGDTVRSNLQMFQNLYITGIKEDRYCLPNDWYILFKNQDDFELVEPKFDINSLKPYDKVLVKEGNSENYTWYPTLVSYVENNSVFTIDDAIRHYIVIPFEGNEHLINTNNDPDEKYITWNTEN